MSITVLEHQPDFPKEDLSNKNADFFELFLQNSDLVELSHPVAEQSRTLYVMAHRAITSAANILDSDHYSHGSLSSGISYYEIISSMVAMHPPLEQEARAAIAAQSLVSRLDDKSAFINLMVDARDKFTSEQPNAAEVIKSAASRYHKSAEQYAVVGAAVIRDLELQAEEIHSQYDV